MTEFAVIPLVTSRWHTINAMHRDGDHSVVPVRTSLGQPRWWSWTKGVPYIAELAPYGLLDLEDQDEFTAKYRDRLDRHGPRKIEQRFAAIYAEYLRPLALLCYEDVNSGEFCHRRIFAAWWREQTGQRIEELHPSDRHATGSPADQQWTQGTASLLG